MGEGLGFQPMGHLTVRDTELWVDASSLGKQAVPADWNITRGVQFAPPKLYSAGRASLKRLHAKFHSRVYDYRK